MARMTSKVAIVTGGARGIGFGVAKRLLEEDARVVVAAVSSEGEVVAKDMGAEFVRHDVAEERSWHMIVKKTLEKYGRLDVLVNNAGIWGAQGPKDPENMPVDDWRRLYAVNVEGVFMGCKAAIPALARSGGGAIVNIASVAAHVPMPFAVAYGAGKAGVVHMTRSIALHCASKGYGIRCNSVSPGQVVTPTMERIWSEIARDSGRDHQDIKDSDRSRIPLRNFQEAADIANAVLFLASDEARCITGVDIRVDGGIELIM